MSVILCRLVLSYQCAAPVRFTIPGKNLCTLWWLMVMMGMCFPRRYASQGALDLNSLSVDIPPSGTSDDDSSFQRFRPVMRVRGVPSNDLTIPLNSLGGGLGSAAAANSFHHQHHHRSIHHSFQQYALDDTFIDFKATHHHRSAFDLDDLLQSENVIGARLSGAGTAGASGSGNGSGNSAGAGIISLFTFEGFREVILFIVVTQVDVPLFCLSP